MNDRTKLGFRIIQYAAILGIAGDILLRQTPWGLNVFLFNLLFVGATAMLIIRRRSNDLLNGQTIALLAAQLFFAAMFVVRDSIELRVADTFAIVTIMSVLIVPKFKIASRFAGVFHYIAGFVWSAFNAWFASFILLGSDIKWKSATRSGWSRHAVAVLRGLAIVAPILFIFGGLFVAADAVYQGMIERVFNIQPEIIITHTLLFAAFSWMSAGYLRGVMLGNDTAEEEKRAAPSVPKTPEATAASAADTRDPGRSDFESSPHLPDFRTAVEHINISDSPDAPEPSAEPRASAMAYPHTEPDPDTTAANAEDRGSARTGQTTSNRPTFQPQAAISRPFNWANIDNSSMPPVFTLGSIEIGLIFGLIDLLFLSFVIVQIPYLFGGMDLVQNTPDFKLAEYARRGFGELVAVSALVLPILLAAHWLVRKDSPVAAKLFRVLAGVQIVLLFVIMASAVQRLVLLTGNLGYGMTTVRLYPMIVMTWLAIVFVWFALTVLRGTRQYFAWGALWSAFFVLGSTNLLNPDKFIANTNIALMARGREFDARYNSHLSDDALPTLIGSFSLFNEKDQEIVLRDLAYRYCKKREEADVRSWNLSRQNASVDLSQYDEILDGIGCASERTSTFPPPAER
jgi:uncharacterized protein DUF4153